MKIDYKCFILSSDCHLIDCSHCPIFSGDFEVLGATKLISQGEKDWQANRQFVRFPVFAHHVEGTNEIITKYSLFSYLEF